MGSPRRTRSCRALAVLGSSHAVAVLFALAAAPRAARADEVIDDPELRAPAAAAKPAAGDETISDPEAGGAQASPGKSPEPAPHADAGEMSVRAVLHSRVGLDTAWDRAAEDILEETTIGLVEAQYRKTESLLFSVGLRARHASGMRHDGSTRYELDAVPVSAYVDGAVGRSVHLRAGYQTISMGRFDLFAASNFLGVYDLRSGPVSMPDALDVAQPAVRLDWDPTTAFTVQAFYVPFFTPDLLPVYGTDYSFLDRTLGNPGLTPAPQPLEQQLGRAGVGRSALVSGSSQALRALAPPADFTTPQGALRATTRGAAGEASFTAGTALERIPAVRATAALPGFRLDYGRFYVASTDGALDAGPFQVGAEVAFLGHRTMGTVSKTVLQAGQPDHANLLHVALRGELVETAGFLAEVEVFTQYALNAPGDPSRQWFTMEEGRYWRGVAGGLQYAPGALPLRLELAAAVVSGPTVVFMPRAQYEVSKGLFAELGAAFVEGPAPSAQSPMVSLGGIFDDVDQVFLGLRWVP